MIRSSMAVCTTALLILLWSYTAISKLIRYEEYADQMRNQPLPLSLSSLLTWLIPVSATVLAVGLLIKRTRRMALGVSAVVLLAFCSYITLIILNTFHYIPCSCAGMASSLSWGQHLVINSVLALMATGAFKFEKRNNVPS